MSRTTRSRKLIVSPRLTASVVRLFLGACAWGSGVPFAQPTSRIAAQELPPGVTRTADTLPSCRECTITFSPIVSRGQMDDPFLLPGHPEVARLSDGSLLAFAIHRRGFEALFYPADGGPVRQLGGSGEGPGEYQFAQGVAVGANDSIYLTHDYRSVSVYTPGGRFVRSVRSPDHLSGPGEPRPPDRISGPVIPREDGALVVVGGKAEGTPLHVIRETGLIETSFRAEGVTRLGPAFDQTRVVAPGARGTIWVAERRNYRFQRLSPDGVLERTVGVQPPESWNTELFMSMAELDSVSKGRETIRLTGSGPQEHELPPFFAITGMYESSDGRLWVSSIVARDGWEDVELKYDRRAFNLLFMNDVLDEVRFKLYRTVVDVIDPDTGGVQARGEIDGIGQILNDGSFVRTSYSDLGIVQLEVFALEITGGW